jgi:hypothetical protein
MFYSHEGNSSFTSTRSHASPRVLTRWHSSHIAQIWRRDRLVLLPFHVHAFDASTTDHPLTRLVATLGSKSNLKKVSRKAILDVDVSKTCDTIIAAPMALRLSSNLLCVSPVKCRLDFIVTRKLTAD